VRESSDTPLAEWTTLRLGGPARRFVEVDSGAELCDVVSDADRAGEPVLLLAGGSNLVIADEGWPGTVVAVGSRGIEEHREGSGAKLTVAAGEPWERVVEHCVERGLIGVECLAGIPGSTGATPIQNVGAYG
jgi:UDP-N-acetylmuramate dehydrogenase